jgi:hypothetical protein
MARFDDYLNIIAADAERIAKVAKELKQDQVYILIDDRVKIMNDLVMDSQALADAMDQVNANTQAYKVKSVGKDFLKR